MSNFKFSFEAIGTKWVIECFDTNIPQFKISSLIKDRIELFDLTYSRFREDSLVAKISKNKGEYAFPEDAKKLFELYDKLYKITDGKFTLLIGNTLDEAGYDASYSLKPRKIQKVPKVSEVFSYQHPKLTVYKPHILDFGGLGKGYLIDIIGELLLENGVNSFCIDAGGDILFRSVKKQPLDVGLEHPEDFKQVIGVAKILNQSICASSGNRRRWEGFHHIIDPQTLSSPENILSTWVVAKDAMTADAMATCLFLTDPDKLAKDFEFEYLILYPDYTIEQSADFPAELFFEKS